MKSSMEALVKVCEQEEGLEGHSDILEEGYTEGQLCLAAANYLLATSISSFQQVEKYDGPPPLHGLAELRWPFNGSCWTPGDRKTMLMKAGALNAAVLGRIERAHRETIAILPEPAQVVDATEGVVVSITDFLDDLKSLSCDELEKERRIVVEQVDETRSYLEAICAEQRARDEIIARNVA